MNEDEIETKTLTEILPHLLEGGLVRRKASLVTLEYRLADPGVRGILSMDVRAPDGTGKAPWRRLLHGVPLDGYTIVPKELEAGDVLRFLQRVERALGSALNERDRLLEEAARLSKRVAELEACVAEGREEIPMEPQE